MKKKVLVIIPILVTMVIILLMCLSFISFGTTTYKMPNSEVTLEIPKLSMIKEECCMFSASFKTFRSKLVIQKELDKIMNNYEKKICNNKFVYYSKKNNITITEYGINGGLLFNTFYITYDKGNYDNNYCRKVTDPTKLKYRTEKCSTEKCYWDTLSYRNKDGNIYKLDPGSFYLIFQSGTGTMFYLHEMLTTGWMSMQDVMDFLEYQVMNKVATKEVFRDGGSILYRNKGFSLLKCNTLDGNQDIYVRSPDFEYKGEYCK